MSNYIDKLKKGSRELGVELNEQQLDQFIKYMEILKEWNQKMNLTAIDDEEEIVIKHFLDSISCIKGADFGQIKRVIDVGTGAGFPGVPLKILFPHLELTLLDSLKKRITFLKHVGSELGFENIEYIHGRAEDYGQDEKYREKYDCSLARAVASLNILSEYTLPFVKVGGIFLSQRGSEVKDDIIQGEEAIDRLGGSFYDLIEVEVPYLDADRSLVVIDKVVSTPDKYPRRAGKPKKRPL
ncbi:16S rRNA (guanine(527)-N(7))-methyltransferase RsmG [Halonatronum saccharophilum]|uniref:16S rRNA (guanine(527)-N(7))-methyltransferase RsmG n=1 Tax=Halonatronum saccharophilum TaxID=150060 RepID=UPI0004849DB0|nr:16S rRNA (guanine(527)-N(7))-methyltransferase RsmG [Halonatronum saccharophilum]